MKNVQRFLFSSKTSNERKFCFARSSDDKAHLRPGTSEGFEKTRNVRILTLTNEGARQLPKYDWPERMMYQTPATHRILNKEGVEVDGKEKLISSGNKHIVIVRPKQIVDSSGTTWANETHRLRCLFPDDFEVKREVTISRELRCFTSRLQGDLYLFSDMSMAEDVGKVTSSPTCPNRNYEKKRVEHLIQRLQLAETDVEACSTQLQANEQQILHEIHLALSSTKEYMSVLQRKLDTSLLVTWNDYQELLHKCSEMLELLKSFHLPAVKPRWADFTDAGPGVGVSNFEVQFRDAELARIFSSDYRIRVHRARGDSGQNEAERTNSAIGDSVVDGATLNWEHFTRFEGLPEDEIAKLSLQEYDKLEEERMTKNAWRVAHQVAARIDDAPVHFEYIKCFVADKPNDGIFLNQEYLKEYSRCKSTQGKVAVPGLAYMQKIDTFRSSHYEYGELYMEYLRGDCGNTSCDKTRCNYCMNSEWTGPVMTRIPRPCPDESRLPDYHYKDVFDTPTDARRPPDDWQPRHHIKKKFAEGSLKLEDEEAINLFSKRFIVQEELVRAYLQHLINLERLKKLRKADKQQKKKQTEEKRFEECDWETLSRTGQAQKLLVHELDKYLKHFDLSLKGKKPDKVRRILVHICSKKQEDIASFAAQIPPPNAPDGADSESSAEETDSDEDIVIAYPASDTEAADAVSQELETLTEAAQLPRQTRSGRTITASHSRYKECFFY